MQPIIRVSNLAKHFKVHKHHRGFWGALRNLATRGEEIIPGDTPADGLWHETVEKAMDMIGWDEPLPEGRGRGLAVGGGPLG